MWHLLSNYYKVGFIYFTTSDGIKVLSYKLGKYSKIGILLSFSNILLKHGLLMPDID